MSDPLGLVGTTIADKYAVETIVGEGGFATVYRAQHTLWKRPVAVKVFKALSEVAAADREKLLKDFIQEGALLADLSERSTAICQARDVGMLKTAKGDEVPYMVLEWLEGMPLDAVLANEQASGAPLRSLEEAVRLLDPAAEALALAHKKGIAHRDVKPANVFVLGDARGEEIAVKLLDFGIAKVVQDAHKMGFGKTGGGVTSFTPAYGAPEQFNRTHGATGPWTDVFSLALVATEVLTGREPLQGDTLVQLALASSDPSKRPTPRTLGASISDEAEAVFAKALAVKPDDRYASAGEFWNALRMVAIGRPMPGDVSVRTDQLAHADTALVVPSGHAETLPAPPKPEKKTSMVGLGIMFVVLAGGAYAGVSALVGKPKKPPPMTVASAAASAMAAATCPAGMKKIAGGEYFMGSDARDAEPNEKPPHKVRVSPYCLDEFEVTVAQYKACSDRGACLRAAKENRWEEPHPITAAQREVYDPLCNIHDPEGNATHPINCVDWEQAAQFCSDRGARLPTEAEWEFAARGSDGRIYPWGDTAPSADLLNACGAECAAWMKTHPDPDHTIATMFEGDDNWPNTAPVGSFPKGKSSWGIQDMVGNVWEWVADWYAEYPSVPSGMITDPKGPATGERRVIRGGGWNGARPSWVRPSFRFYDAPNVRSYGVGFRCAKSLAL